MLDKYLDTRVSHDISSETETEIVLKHSSLMWTQKSPHDDEVLEVFLFYFTSSTKKELKGLKKKLKILKECISEGSSNELVSEIRHESVKRSEYDEYDSDYIPAEHSSFSSEVSSDLFDEIEDTIFTEKTMLSKITKSKKGAQTLSLIAKDDKFEVYEESKADSTLSDINKAIEHTSSVDPENTPILYNSAVAVSESGKKFYVAKGKTIRSYVLKDGWANSDAEGPLKLTQELEIPMWLNNLSDSNIFKDITESSICGFQITKMRLFENDTHLLFIDPYDRRRLLSFNINTKELVIAFDNKSILLDFSITKWIHTGKRRDSIVTCDLVRSYYGWYDLETFKYRFMPTATKKTIRICTVAMAKTGDTVTGSDKGGFRFMPIITFAKASTLLEVKPHMALSNMAISDWEGYVVATAHNWIIVCKTKSGLRNAFTNQIKSKLPLPKILKVNPDDMETDIQQNVGWSNFTAPSFVEDPSSNTPYIVTSIGNWVVLFTDFKMTKKENGQYRLFKIATAVKGVSPLPGLPGQVVVLTESQVLIQKLF